MNTFKQSAIEILRKAKTPLHYNEITKQALESGILETEGANPERTMNAVITVDTIILTKYWRQDDKRIP
jgi:hypothetical protein